MILPGEIRVLTPLVNDLRQAGQHRKPRLIILGRCADLSRFPSHEESDFGPEIEGLVWLRPGSRFAGGLITTNLVVEGDFRGTVRATEKVDMRATCHVIADVTASKVAAAEGSYIEGRITVAERSDETVGYAEKREQGR